MLAVDRVDLTAGDGDQPPPRGQKTACIVPEVAAPPTPEPEEEEDVGGRAAPAPVPAGAGPAGHGWGGFANMAGEAPPTPEPEEDQDDEEGMGYGGFLPDDEDSGGGFVVEEEGPAAPPRGKGSPPEQELGGSGSILRRGSAGDHAHVNQGVQRDPGSSASAVPAILQPPTARCPEWRMIPVGGFVPSDGDSRARGGVGSRGTAGGTSGQGGAAAAGEKSEAAEKGCVECGDESFHAQFKETFGVHVCKSCAAQDEKVGSREITPASEAPTC